MAKSIPPELWRNVHYILTQSDTHLYRVRSDDPSIKHAFRVGYEPPAGVYESPTSELSSEHVMLLKKLYASLTADQQEVFVPALLGQLSAENAAVVALTIAELRALATLRSWTRIDNAGIAFWHGIVIRLQMEHWTFTDEDLDHVAAGINDAMLHAEAAIKSPRDIFHSNNAVNMSQFVRDEFKPVFDRVKFLRLANSLRNFDNPVIDTDRQVLLSRLETLGFSGKLADALQEVERKGVAAAAPIEFKIAMDLLRTFFEEFVEEAARLVETKTGVSITGTGNFQPFKDYLRNQKVITNDELELVQKLYNYLSNAGTHVLGSAPEQWHVAKVTVLEWTMMIAGRVAVLL